MDFNINDYLYAIRRRLWLPIAVPLAAALVTSGVIYLQPEQYQATATVIVPALSAKGYSTSAVTQYFSTYKDVLTSTPVINRVAAETGESKSNLAAGLSANVVTASSNIIEVTYVGPSKKTVDNVASVAATDALDVLLGPQQSAAQAAVSTAQTTLTAADQKLADFIARTGHTFPEDDYKFTSQNIAQLELNLQQAILARDGKRITGLQTVIAQRQNDLKALVPIVIEWQGINQGVSAAQAEVDHAQIDLNAVNAEIASDHAPGTVTVKSLGHISRLPNMLKYGGVAGGVALLLALAFIVFMEFFRPAVAQVPYLRKLAIPARPSTAGAVALAPVAVGSGGVDEVAIAPAAVASGGADEVAMAPAAVASDGADEFTMAPAAVASDGADEVVMAPVAVASDGADDVAIAAVASGGADEVEMATVAVPADGKAREMSAVKPSGNGDGPRKKGR